MKRVIFIIMTLLATAAAADDELFRTLWRIFFRPLDGTSRTETLMKPMQMISAYPNTTVTWTTTLLENNPERWCRACAYPCPLPVAPDGNGMGLYNLSTKDVVVMLTPPASATFSRLFCGRHVPPVYFRSLTDPYASGLRALARFALLDLDQFGPAIRFYFKDYLDMLCGGHNVVALWDYAAFHLGIKIPLANVARVVTTEAAPCSIPTDQEIIAARRKLATALTQ